MVEQNFLLNSKEKVDHRLKRRNHFTYIYRKGKRKSTKHLTLFTVPSRFKIYKIGYSVSKKLGKANVRNLLKRRLKEIVRTSYLTKHNFNYVLLARDGAEKLDFQALKNEVFKVFECEQD